jgi:hypothetical protein
VISTLYPSLGLPDSQRGRLELLLWICFELSLGGREGERKRERETQEELEREKTLTYSLLSKLSN